MTLCDKTTAEAILLIESNHTLLLMIMFLLNKHYLALESCSVQLFTLLVTDFNKGAIKKKILIREMNIDRKERKTQTYSNLKVLNVLF